MTGLSDQLADFEDHYMPRHKFFELLEKGGMVEVPQQHFRIARFLAEEYVKLLGNGFDAMGANIYKANFSLKKI